MTGALSRRRVVSAGLLVWALASMGMVEASGQTTGPVPVAGVNAAYHPGAMDGGVIPSEPVEYEGEWLTVTANSVGRRSLEPTIGVDRKGRAFYAASWHGDSKSIVLPVTEVRRSTDGGATWTNVSPLIPATNDPNPPVNADPYVYVDQDTDRVFNPEAAGACLYMNISDDAGESWITNPVVCGNINVDHQSFEGGPFPPAFQALKTIYPNVLWYCSNQVILAQCSRSFDGGLAWTGAPTPPFHGYDPAAGGLCLSLAGHVEVDSKGRAVLPKGHCGAPWIAITEDLGATWTRTRVSSSISAASTHIAAAFDDADNLYVVWWDSANRLPWLAVSRDHGRTFGAPMMVAPPGVTEVNFPEITAGEEGKVAITFPGNTSSNRSNTRRPWNNYILVSTNVLDERPLFVSTTANTLEDPVHRGNCGPGRCGPMWDFIDIVSSPLDGGVWSTISDSCESDSCRAPNGSMDTNIGSSGMGYAIRQVGGPTIRTPKPPDD
ncbi:MAG: glycoside hydrolase [Actinomycetota bacterium]|nr:glycoside hydrolase [Actinomycetota bacterium]